LNEEEIPVETDTEPPLGVEVAIDFRLLLQSSEVGESMNAPDLKTVEGLAKITQAFPDKVVFIAIGQSERWQVMRWLLTHDLFRTFGVTPDRFLFFRRHIDIQHFFLATPRCRFVVSRSKARLSHLAGLKAKRFLLRPGGAMETLRNGLMRNVISVPNYEALYAAIAVRGANIDLRGASQDSVASA